MDETASGEAAHTQANKKGGAVGEKTEGSEGEEAPVGATPNKVDPSGATAVGKEFDDFQIVRQLLRAASTATGQALERMNTRARDARKTR